MNDKGIGFGRSFKGMLYCLAVSCRISLPTCSYISLVVPYIISRCHFSNISSKVSLGRSPKGMVYFFTIAYRISLCICLYISLTVPPIVLCRHFTNTSFKVLSSSVSTISK